MRISQWGMDKNIKPREMQAIVRKRQRRKLVENKAELIFEVRGSVVPPEKIERWMKRNEVVESFPYAPSPAACKLGREKARFLADIPKPRRLLLDAIQSLSGALPR
jgi:hypothetical protein